MTLRFLGALLMGCLGGTLAAHDTTVEPPGVEALCAIDNIDTSNVLADYVAAVIDSAPGEFYGQKVRHAVDHHLSDRTAAYHFITSCLGTWGNGGMQDVLLCEKDELVQKQWELQKTVEAFRMHGCQSTATFLEQLMPKAAQWSKAIAELNEREARGEHVPEADFDRIWSEVDRFDDLFEEAFQKDPDVFQVMTEDVRAHPERYLPNRSAREGQQE